MAIQDQSIHFTVHSKSNCNQSLNNTPCNNSRKGSLHRSGWHYPLFIGINWVERFPRKDCSPLSDIHKEKDIIRKLIKQRNECIESVYFPNYDHPCPPSALLHLYSVQGFPRYIISLRWKTSNKKLLCLKVNLPLDFLNIDQNSLSVNIFLNQSYSAYRPRFLANSMFSSKCPQTQLCAC